MFKVKQNSIWDVDMEVITTADSKVGHISDVEFSLQMLSEYPVACQNWTWLEIKLCTNDEKI